MEDYGPLQFLAEMTENDEADDAGLLLVDAGAHLDRVNQEGDTAAEIYFYDRDFPEEPALLPDWLRKVSSLKCMSARVIRQQNLPYLEEGALPTTLLPFVAIHGETHQQ